MGRPPGVLARRAFRLLWAGQSVSTAGDALTEVALVFAVLDAGGGPAGVGYVIAAQSGTRVAFILAGGVWADRLRREQVMIAADVARAVVQAALAALLLAGHAQVWQLGAGAVACGAASAFFGPAQAGVLPEMVPAAELQRANGLLGFTGGLARVGGPALAGVLVAAFGPGVVFAADAATFAVSAASLAGLRLPPRARAARQRLTADLAAGWREMAARPWYWLTLIAHAVWNFAIPVFWVLGPVVCARQLGGPAAWGVIAGAWSGGGVIGAAIAMRARPARPLVWANAALGASALPVAALAPPLPVWAVAGCAVAGGCGVVFLAAVWSTAMQSLIPDAARSRVDSYDWLISLAVMPAGYVLAGPAAEALGTGPVLWAGAALLAVPGAAAALLVPGIRAVRRGDAGGYVMARPAAGGSAR